MCVDRVNCTNESGATSEPLTCVCPSDQSKAKLEMGLPCVPLGLEAVKADLIIFYFPEIQTFSCVSDR